MVKNNKKAISPVVATALLLVVAVVAVVGFQTWFQTYQSGVLVDVEQQSDSSTAITVERVENVNATAIRVYVKNAGDTRVDYNQLSFTDSAGATCINSSTSQGVIANTVNSSTVAGGACAPTVGTTVDLLITTDDGVISGEYIVR